jgi:hypothetical protein
LPLTLAAGESFAFRVTFAPQNIGRAHGSVSIVSGSPERALRIQLAGTDKATGHLQVTPAAIDFGDASVGSTGTRRGQLTASGASVTISSATISSEDFQWAGLRFPSRFHLVTAYPSRSRSFQGTARVHLPYFRLPATPRTLPPSKL